MGRNKENARPRNVRPLSDGKAARLLDSTHGVIVDDVSRLPRDVGVIVPNSRSIAEDAKKIIKQADNVPKAVKKLATLTTGFWSSPTAPLVANAAKSQSEYADLVAMMMNAVSKTGSTILAVGALKDLIDGRPLEGSIAGPFSPDRQSALRLAESALVDVCGDEEVFKMFEAPIPEGIRIGFSDGQGGYRYSYDVRPAEPLDVRLASYDYPTVQRYVDSLGNRTWNGIR